MTHPDDKFRLHDCAQCKRLEQEVERLKGELAKAFNVATMYRQQIVDLHKASADKKGELV